MYRIDGRVSFSQNLRHLGIRVPFVNDFKTLRRTICAQTAPSDRHWRDKLQQSTIIFTMNAPRAYNELPTALQLIYIGFLVMLQESYKIKACTLQFICIVSVM